MAGFCQVFVLLFIDAGKGPLLLTGLPDIGLMLEMVSSQQRFGSKIPNPKSCASFKCLSQKSHFHTCVLSTNYLQRILADPPEAFVAHFKWKRQKI